jgi:hypothetical protein
VTALATTRSSSPAAAEGSLLALVWRAAAIRAVGRMCVVAGTGYAEQNGVYSCS